MSTTTINGFLVPAPISHLDNGLDEIYLYTVDPYTTNGYYDWLIDELPDFKPLLALINGAAYESEEQVKAVVSAMRGIDPEWSSKKLNELNGVEDEN